MAEKSKADAAIARLAQMWRPAVGYANRKKPAKGAPSPMQAAIAYHVYAAGGRLGVGCVARAVGRTAVNVRLAVWRTDRLGFADEGKSIVLCGSSAADVEAAMRGY